MDNVRKDLGGKYNTYLFTDRAVETIEKHDQKSPLFLFLSYTSPHGPNQAPSDDVKKYTSHMTASKNRKIYAAQISIMDDGIGKVVKTLKQKGMYDNTLLVFTSDNGAVFGNKGSNYPLRGGKQSLLEGGVRAVAFVHSPLLKKVGYTNTNLHHVTDWYATFQKLAGDDPSKHTKPQLPVDGADIWQSISEDKPVREEVLMNCRIQKMIQDSKDHEFLVKRGFSLDEGLGDDEEDDLDEKSDFFVMRWKNWKLFTGTYKIQGWTTQNSSKVTLQGGSSKQVTGTQLFDLDTDPREQTNIADSHPDVVKEMLKKIISYRNKMTKINKRTHGNVGNQGGVWLPWVPVSAL